jgi:hypothetical protein
LILLDDADYKEMKVLAEGPDHMVNETVDYKPEDLQNLIKEISNSSEKEQIKNQYIDVKSGFKEY